MATYIYTDDYERSHGKKPRGRANWLLEIKAIIAVKNSRGETRYSEHMVYHSLPVHSTTTGAVKYARESAAEYARQFTKGRVVDLYVSFLA